jgi:hypothetical protein
LPGALPQEIDADLIAASPNPAHSADRGVAPPPDRQITSFYQKRSRPKSIPSRENIYLPIFGIL